MYLQDIRIDDLSASSGSALENLPRGITVISGSSEQVLSGWLRGLQGLLSDLRTECALQVGSVGFSGELTVLSRSRLFLLRRSRTAQKADLFFADSHVPGATLPAAAELLPRWIRHESFEQFCIPGVADSAELQMLRRLVDVVDAEFGVTKELERARAALAQVLLDRDGNGLEGGVVHRISALRRRQGELQRKISGLRNPAGEAKARASEIQRKIESVESQLAAIDSQLAALRSELQQLLKMPSPRTSAVIAAKPEDRGTGNAMVDRYRAIRAEMATDLEASRHSNHAGLLLSSDSLSAMRESILRVEEKFRQLSEAGHAGGLSEADMGLAGSSLIQVRQEVTSLNHRLADYEQQLEQQPSSALQPLLEQCLLAVDAVLSELAPQSSEIQPDSNSTARSDELAAEQSRTVRMQELEKECDHNEQQRLQLQQRLLELQNSVGSVSTPTLSARVLEQLDLLQADYGSLDAEVLHLEQQRRQLDGAERTLRELIGRLAEQPRSSVLEAAALLLQRFTGRELMGFRKDTESLFILQAGGTHVRLAELPLQQRIPACLALRLALLQICGSTDGRLPLILRGELLRQVPETTAEFLQVLHESSEHGQQILLLAEDTFLAELAALPALEVRRLPAPTQPAEVAPPRLVLHRAEPEVEEQVTPVVGSLEQSTSPVALNADLVATEAFRKERANWLFYLEPDDGVEELAAISLGELEALRAARIVHVADLLDRTIPDLEESIRLRGFIVPVERLQALRGQAELAGRVPMLRRGDAALLYAAGITTADELRRLRPETVYERVAGFQRTDAGARWRRAGRLIDRQQSLNWARYGQFSRSLEELRAAFPATPSVPTTSTTRSTNTAAAVHSSSQPATPTDAANAQSGPSAAETENTRVIITRRRKQVPESSANTARRARRVAKREQLAAQLRVDPQPSVPVEGQPVERLGGMRFYLSRTSDVVQAPSIGPKTAEILHTAGVRTIEELLSIPAERISEKLNQKKLTADVVRRWQVQAQLVCRIPELRGHDAQILAACGIHSPESLSDRNPEELLNSMKPFLESAEGRKVLRNQPGPNLQEVTEWIQWAANARPLRAA